ATEITDQNGGGRVEVGRAALRAPEVAGPRPRDWSHLGWTPSEMRVRVAGRGPAGRARTSEIRISSSSGEQGLLEIRISLVLTPRKARRHEHAAAARPEAGAPRCDQS